MESKFYWRLIFETLIHRKPSLGPCEVPKKIYSVDLMFIGYKRTGRETMKEKFFPKKYLSIP